jgi:nitrate reductase gamma subunit
MSAFISVFLIILYLAVLVYLIWLFSRLVHAVERIAKNIEGSSKI